MKEDNFTPFAADRGYVPAFLKQRFEEEAVEAAQDENIGEAGPRLAVSSDHKALLCRELASTFVRKEGRFYRRSRPGSSMSGSDLKRVALNLFLERHPDIEVTDELWRSVHKHAVEAIHTDRAQTIPVWDGRLECHAGHEEGVLWSDGVVTMNSWSFPEYRQLPSTNADTAMFDDLLDRMLPQPADREVVKDFLSWTLQNEDDKPAWCLMFYSQTKGTGKSTLTQLMAKLFGEKNSIVLNGVSKLLGKFNQTVLNHKFIGCEEVKLKPGTEAGNAIKAIISEKSLGVEGKGKEVESIRNVSVVAATTNHFPHWLEPDDRRFYVVDANHSGHASGPDHEGFQAFMKEFHRYMSTPQNITNLYQALLTRKQSNSFNARSLNIAAVDTPIMRQVHSAAGEVLVQVLEEAIARKGIYAWPQASLRDLFVELKANPNRIAHLMRELRWYQQKAKWGGIDYARVVWVHPEYIVADGRVLGPNHYDEPVSPAEEAIEVIV
ncbi:primase-helicase family protein [Sulfitobacter sp. 1A10445]|uniref:primase-helicase family protein n=1 Tax=unclassified Sulfitobacter TaxID=196795 RepID=UPI003746A915